MPEQILTRPVPTGAGRRPTTPEGVPAPSLPRSRGPLGDAVLALLGPEPPAPGAEGAPAVTPELTAEIAAADPYGGDLHVALSVCYELHYRGFAGVHPDREWDPALLSLRAALEQRFLTALRADLPDDTDLRGALEDLLTEPPGGAGVSRYLSRSGEWWQMREYLVHRSIYHLKEADPHAWAIPRLTGRAKAALVAVEFDEYGGGRADRIHAHLFAELLEGAGLESGYLAYVDVVPSPALAVVNLMSLFGLHRTLRGALVGHFAAAEITTPPSARRLVRALQRMGAPERCARFYTEHIEADAVHEQLMRHDVIADLLEREPELRADVVFGIRATGFLEARLGRLMLDAWARDRSSLIGPMRPGGAPAAA
ncbi:iron-containing redox enzyme family protein [Streptomyces sp. ST2-7A]|uniref:iron-containing redox enzyme family protein n=1 Tax=Streptomyces sp. ST2-7A TaxID=2907214 RepID=UPI001F3127CE|nr:iron-containing redox enzyme family protein [Streptomyces sp. ST2-7A]MCE7081659.1 iron-containing redox enzyme family protein [Streptomyces sp. ST2-7A]